jgi:hypothetical protein
MKTVNNVKLQLWVSWYDTTEAWSKYDSNYGTLNCNIHREISELSTTVWKKKILVK